MKNLKTIITYGVILLLCIAAFGGYMLSKKSSQAQKAAIVGTTGTGTANATEDEETRKQNHIKELMQKAMAEPDANPVVGIGRGTDYAAVTAEAVKNAGGLEGIIKKGDTVLIKPNICTFAEAGSGRITHYLAVQEIARMASELGASRVIVAEGTIAGNAFDKSFLAVNKYDLIEGVELLNLNAFTEQDCYELQPEPSLTGKAIFIPKIYMDADVVITFAKLKTHLVPEAVASLSLKNAYGVPPGQIYGVGSKDALHALGFVDSVLDINRIRKPEFALIEGIVGGEGDGPLSNTPVESNIIFAGKDLVALDTVAITFMGFNARYVSLINEASQEKMGISDLSQIKINGADLESIKMKFKMAVRP